MSIAAGLSRPGPSSQAGAGSLLPLADSSGSPRADSFGTALQEAVQSDSVASSGADTVRQTSPVGSDEPGTKASAAEESGASDLAALDPATTALTAEQAEFAQRALAFLTSAAASELTPAEALGVAAAEIAATPNDADASILALGTTPGTSGGAVPAAVAGAVISSLANATVASGAKAAMAGVALPRSVTDDTAAAISLTGSSVNGATSGSVVSGLSAVEGAAQNSVLPSATVLAAPQALTTAATTVPDTSSALAAPIAGSAADSADVPVPILPPATSPPAAVGAAAVTPAAAAPPALPVPLTSQVAPILFSLAAAGLGEHVMTLQVTPENLGPLTVRAIVGADGIRIELIAPSDVSREALRAILPDLRRDLAGSGLNAQLDLSDHAESSDPRAGAEADRQDETQDSTHRSSDQDSAHSSGMPSPSSFLFGTSSTIDVMA